MRLTNSLAIPIIILLVAMACGTLCIGYYLNIHSLRQALEARERDKADNACLVIAAAIKEKLADLDRLTKLLSKDQQLSAALDFYYQPDHDLRPL